MPCRRHRSGDLCHRGRPGDRRQIPLPEKRDVPKPGSEGRQTGRQPGLPLQQPGGLSERLRRKPKGVFHLNSPMARWTSGCRRDGRLSLPASGLYPQSHSETTGSGSTACGGQRGQSTPSVAFLLLYCTSWLFGPEQATDFLGVDILVNTRTQKKFQMFHYRLCNNFWIMSLSHTEVLSMMALLFVADVWREYKARCSLVGWVSVPEEQVLVLYVKKTEFFLNVTLFYAVLPRSSVPRRPPPTLRVYFTKPSKPWGISEGVHFHTVSWVWGIKKESFFGQNRQRNRSCWMPRRVHQLKSQMFPSGFPQIKIWAERMWVGGGMEESD